MDHNDTNTSNHTKQAEELNKQANNKYKDKNYIEAIDLYTQAIKISEETILVPHELISKYYSNRCNSYLCLNQFEDAINDANKSLSLYENYKSYYRKGTALKKLKYYQEAKSEFSKAYRLVPSEDVDLKLSLANEVKECIIITSNFYLLFQYSNNKKDNYGRLLGIFDNKEIALKLHDKSINEYYEQNTVGKDVKPEIITYKSDSVNNISVVKISNNSSSDNNYNDKSNWIVFSLKEVSGNIMKEFLIIVNIVYDFPYNFDNKDRAPTDFNIIELDNCINSEIQEVNQFNSKEFDMVKGKKTFFVKLNKYYEVEI